MSRQRVIYTDEASTLLTDWLICTSYSTQSLFNFDCVYSYRLTILTSRYGLTVRSRFTALTDYMVEQRLVVLRLLQNSLKTMLKSIQFLSQRLR